MTQVTRLLQLELQTAAPAALTAFYRDMLQLPVQLQPDHSVVVPIGGSTIRFQPTEQGEPVYHFAFNIPENKIDGALEWLRPRAQLIPHFKTGALIIDWPFWHAHSVYFLDPAGNILEVIARHQLNNAASGDFTGHDLLNVSEIGLVVPDPHATIALLAQAFDLPTRSLLEDFGAVGDDHGLFIVSAEDRPWMPTDYLRAHHFPASIMVQHAAAVHIAIPGTSYTIAAAE